MGRSEGAEESSTLEVSEGSTVELELHVGRVPETGVSAVSLLATLRGGSNKSGMERKVSIMDAGLLPREMETEGLLSGEIGSLEASGTTGVTAIVLAFSLGSSVGR